MKAIETIREFKTRNFLVRVQAVEDPDLDLSFDETGETAKALDRGDLMVFGVLVKVYLKGSSVGSDSLWGCIYKTPKDFMDHFGLKAKGRADGCNYGSYFVDMVRNSISEARATIADFRNVKVRA